MSTLLTFQDNGVNLYWAAIAHNVKKMIKI